MKKIFLNTIFSFLTVFCFFPLVNSVNAADESFGLKPAMQATGGSVREKVLGSPYYLGAIEKIISIALGFLGIFFFGLVLYAGLRWMFAMGKSEDISKAKDMLEQAGIGLVIVLSAYAIAKFVFGLVLGG